jgi:hypothetical protein
MLAAPLASHCLSSCEICSWEAASKTLLTFEGLLVLLPLLLLLLLLTASPALSAGVAGVLHRTWGVCTHGSASGPDLWILMLPMSPYGLFLEVCLGVSCARLLPTDCVT